MCEKFLIRVFVFITLILNVFFRRYGGSCSDMFHPMCMTCVEDPDSCLECTSGAYSLSRDTIPDDQASQDHTDPLLPIRGSRVLANPNSRAVYSCVVYCPAGTYGLRIGPTARFCLRCPPSCRSCSGTLFCPNCIMPSFYQFWSHAGNKIKADVIL